MNGFINALSSDPGIAIAALAIIVGCGTGIIITATAMVAGSWATVRETEETNALKQYMLEQGHTAEEVALVVSAKPGKTKQLQAHIDLARESRLASPPPLRTPQTV
jgi:hypothetical protein